jgi:cytochrome P450
MMMIIIIIEWPVDHKDPQSRAKWVEKDDVLPDGTRVFAHTWVCFSAYAMGRLPQLWEDPFKCARPPR